MRMESERRMFIGRLEFLQVDLVLMRYVTMLIIRTVSYLCAHQSLRILHLAWADGLARRRVSWESVVDGSSGEQTMGSFSFGRRFHLMLCC
jgi:hypothetical protein